LLPATIFEQDGDIGGEHRRPQPLRISVEEPHYLASRPARLRVVHRRATQNQHLCTHQQMPGWSATTAHGRQERGRSSLPITLSDCNWSAASTQVSADLGGERDLHVRYAGAPT
jgi:hypothetical protein